MGKAVKFRCGCATVIGEPIGQDATVLQRLEREGTNQVMIRKPGHQPG